MNANAGAAVGPAGTADSGETAIPDTGAVLELLDDEHTRAILAALVDEPKSAREIVSDCRCSRPTVYRRLERLCEAGLVESSMQFDADGHHRKLFRRRLDSVAIDLSAGGWSVSVDAVGPRRTGQ